MRISDWSSDVCSSDLRSLCGASALLPGSPRYSRRTTQRQRRRHLDWASLRHVRCAYGRPCPDRGEKAWRPARRGDNVCRRRNGSGGIVRGALMKELLSTIPGGPETLELRDVPITEDRKSTRLNSSH